MLAGKVIGEEVEGSLPWIVTRLLEGNNYSGLLLRLDPQGGLEGGYGGLGEALGSNLCLTHPLTKSAAAPPAVQREPDPLGGPGFRKVPGWLGCQSLEGQGQ